MTSVENIKISDTGIMFDSIDSIQPKTWDSFWATSMAIQDFIDPPTGEELRDVLFGLNGAPDKPEEYQIIRWIV